MSVRWSSVEQKVGLKYHKTPFIVKPWLEVRIKIAKISHINQKRINNSYLKLWFFSNLIGEEGPRSQGFVF